MNFLKPIAVRLKDGKGRKYHPATIKVNIVLYVQAVKRWECTLSLFNRRTDLIEQAASIIPEYFSNYIVTAEIHPIIDPIRAVVCVRFDCDKDGL